jgi:hypothetical protein
MATADRYRRMTFDDSGEDVGEVRISECMASMRRNVFDKNFAYVRLVSSVASARLPGAAHAAELIVPCPIGMVLANPTDAETSGTVLIHGSWGCFYLKLPATLSPPGDRTPGPYLEAHQPAARAHTLGGQYLFQRACPLEAFITLRL